jgi:transcriptional regulator with XRE-family HTH domain
VESRQVVGGRLRAQRRRAGLSTRELGRRIGVSASAISEFERGKTWPKIGTLCRLAVELDLSLDGLFADVLLPNDRRHTPVQATPPTPAGPTRRAPER